MNFTPYKMLLKSFYFYNYFHLNLTHALGRNEAPFNGRLQRREQVPASRGQRDGRVEQELVGVRVRKVGELRAEGRDLQVDVVIAVQ